MNVAGESKSSTTSPDPCSLTLQAGGGPYWPIVFLVALPKVEQTFLPPFLHWFHFSPAQPTLLFFWLAQSCSFSSDLTFVFKEFKDRWSCLSSDAVAQYDRVKWLKPQILSFYSAGAAKSKMNWQVLGEILYDFPLGDVKSYPSIHPSHVGHWEQKKRNGFSQILLSELVHLWGLLSEASVIKGGWLTHWTGRPAGVRLTGAVIAGSPTTTCRLLHWVLFSSAWSFSAPILLWGKPCGSTKLP